MHNHEHDVHEAEAFISITAQIYWWGNQIVDKRAFSLLFGGSMILVNVLLIEEVSAITNEILCVSWKCVKK